VMKHRSTQNVVDAVALAGRGTAGRPGERHTVAANTPPWRYRPRFDSDHLLVHEHEHPAVRRFGRQIRHINMTQQAPAMFGPTLSLIGAGNSRWIRRSTTLEAPPAGVCGAGNAKVDTVVAIDHRKYERQRSQEREGRRSPDGGRVRPARWSRSDAAGHPADARDTAEDWYSLRHGYQCR
jgi:hypothetical protein